MDIEDIGTRKWTEKVITETYKSKSDGTMSYGLSFYSDRVEMTRLYNCSNAGSSYCVFETANDALYIRSINAPLPRFENFGTLALMRLEEKSAAGGLKWMKIVNSENDYYWENILHFTKVFPKEFLRGSPVDFAKRILEPPIKPKAEFELIEVRSGMKNGIEWNAEKFEADVASALGLSIHEYRMLDPSEITLKLQRMEPADERKPRKHGFFEFVNRR